MPPLRVVELFAGVGGFHLGLPEPGFRVVWSNQWEPGERAQWASKCYQERFPGTPHSNEDVATVDAARVPAHDVLVGGHPCQDFSVATTKARGIEGKKGVLWWQIDRLVRSKRPRYVMLENVDRLIRSPTHQRGRDFGVELKCFAEAGYNVEWRVLNAADHGFPQKRRRVFVFAARADTPWGRFMGERAARPAYLRAEGFFPRAFPVRAEAAVEGEARAPDATLPKDLQSVSDAFEFHFLNSGVAVDGQVWTYKAHAQGEPVATLGSILDRDVAEEHFVPDADLPRWKYLKGAKAEERVAANGYSYHYKEGAIPFPDRLDQPARTILTHEGARTPSRFNHIVLDPHAQRFRRLTPEEVEKLNGFPPGWTKGMPERKRYFCMGNALVVGLVERMGETLAATKDDPARGLPGATPARERRKAAAPRRRAA